MTNIIFLLNEIDRTTKDFDREFGGLTSDQLNWKAQAEVWSIAQNIDHLIVINETYYPVIQALREGTYSTPFLGKIGFIVNFFDKIILSAVQPDRRRKIKTFPIWQPSNSEISADILLRFAKHHEDLKQLIRDSEDLLKKNLVISSPANSNIVYHLSAAFDIIIAHEKRHLEQAKEVLALLPKP